MSKSYLKGYKDALKRFDELVSTSPTKNDLITKLFAEYEWVNKELNNELEKEKAWEALLTSLDSTFALTQINLQKEGI